MIIYLPILVFVLGLVLWSLTDQPKPAELGRCLMWTGALVTLLELASQTVNVLR